MTELAIVLGLVFMLVCIAFALLHSLHQQRVTLLDWTLLAMGGIYGGGWSLVVFITQAGGNPVWERWLLPFEHLYPLHTLSAFILLGTTYLGWLVAGSLHLGLRQLPNGSLVPNNDRLVHAAWFLLLIALLMQWLYSRAYGGFIGLLEYSAAIRSGIFEVQNALSFLQPFGGLALFASFLFFGLWLSGCRRLDVKIGFALALVFSLYLLFSWLGRIAFLVYLATFVLGVLLARQLRPLPLLVGGGLTMLVILFAAYQVSVWLNLKAADNLAFFLARELAFPFGSFLAQLHSGEHLLRAFRDFLIVPVYLLPSSWWANWVEDVGQINTAMIMGAPKGEQGVTGAIPVDLLTLGLMQATAAGIAGLGILFGAVLRVIQRLLEKTRNPGIRAIFEAYVAIKLAMLAIFYAEPALVVSGNFAFLLAVIIIALFANAPRIRVFRKTGHAGAVCPVSPSRVAP
jgi:hypothetical protein